MFIYICISGRGYIVDMYAVKIVNIVSASLLETVTGHRNGPTMTSTMTPWCRSSRDSNSQSVSQPVGPISHPIRLTSYSRPGQGNAYILEQVSFRYSSATRWVETRRDETRRVEASRQEYFTFCFLTADWVCLHGQQSKGKSTRLVLKLDSQRVQQQRVQQANVTNWGWICARLVESRCQTAVKTQWFNNECRQRQASPSGQVSDSVYGPVRLCVRMYVCVCVCECVCKKWNRMKAKHWQTTGTGEGRPSAPQKYECFTCSKWINNQ